VQGSTAEDEAGIMVARSLGGRHGTTQDRDCDTERSAYSRRMKASTVTNAVHVAALTACASWDGGAHGAAR
jgi:hypothetical protein